MKTIQSTDGKNDEKLLNLIKSQVKYFKDKSKHRYALIAQAKGVVKLVPLPSEDFSLWLRKAYYATFKKMISNEAVNNVQNLCTMLAHDDTVEERPIFRRVGQIEQTAYYNLADNDKSMVIVSKDKIEVFNNSSLSFCFEDSLPQVMPNLKSNACDLLLLLGNLFRVDEKDLLLLAVYIVSCFILNLSHPILAVFGREGSAKTSTLKALQQIIDPANGLYRFPSRDSDLIATLASNYFLAFDNLRNISLEMSDTLCQISTGGVVGQRQLYHNTKLINIDIKRCLCLNGINTVATERDLLDRIILIELNRIPDDERITDKVYTSKLQSFLPDILGSIFNSLHGALNLINTVELTEKFRMQDTRLAGLEAVMMLAPFFTRRYNGVIILNRFQYDSENTKCQYCTTYHKGKGCAEKCCPWLTERLEAGAVPYKELLKVCFANLQNKRLKARLQNLASGYCSGWFYNV